MRKIVGYVLAVVFLTLVAACSGQTGLAPGLTARMDEPGATLDRATALNIINQYRVTKAVQPLAQDSSLNTLAQTLADQYAASGKTPKTPESANAMLVSAGYANFAETFSGWRASTPDAATLSDKTLTPAGLGVAYSANSTYGVYWVLLLAN